MFVPSPNEQDYLVWAAQRVDSGDVSMDDWDFGGFIDVAPWTIQCVFDGVRRYGEDSDLEYEDFVVQLKARGGVEPRPWALELQYAEATLELGLHEEDEEGWSEYEEDYDYDYEDEEEGDVVEARIILPIEESYVPATAPEGAAFIDGRAYVVWGDWLWEARPGGELHEVVELPARCELYCTIDSLLVLNVANDCMLYDPIGQAFVRRDVDVPVFREESRAADVRVLRPDSAWVSLPVCTTARIVDVSPDSLFVRIKDRAGRGGIVEVGTWRRVGDAGGPYRDRRPTRAGPKLGGAQMRNTDWRDLLRRIRAAKLRMGKSAFTFYDGRCRYTDNGLTFFEDDELMLVLDRPMHRVDFSVDGREVLASTDDTLVRIDLDAKTIVDTWRQPARLRYLRSVLPPYQPDAYVEQVVALWEVLADPNQAERMVSSMTPP